MACALVAPSLPEDAGSDYAVVVRESTAADPAWREVVEALVRKHGATTVNWTDSVTEALPELKERFPRFACFVVKPNEAGRQFVIDVHRLTRALDDDPYGDTRWGILTGYEAADALRIARRSEPLSVRRFAAGTSFSPAAFEEGVAYDESRQGRLLRKEKGGEVEEASCAPDATQELVEVLNEYRPDYFMTSGCSTGWRRSSLQRHG
jgi:zinc protease